MVGYLWDSVVQSPWSPELAALGLSFMLSLRMSLGLNCCWDFLYWVLPSSQMTEVSPPTMSCMLLCRCGQIVSKLILLSLQGYETSLSLLFRCLFWIISPPFSCNSNLVSVAFTTPLPSSLIIRWWFLCWWVLSSSRYIGVHSPHLLFHVISWRGKAKWIKTVGVYSMEF